MTRESVLANYSTAIDACPRIMRKGKTMPYTSANGHMFSQVNKDNQLGIRFDKAVQTKYMADFETDVFKSYGAVLRGYVLIPDAVIADTTKLADLLNEAYDYVMSLPPK